MRLLVIISAALALTGSSFTQPPLKSSKKIKGTVVYPAPNPGRYSDGRPTASYRLDVSDQGPVLLHGDGPDSCDHLGARDIWLFQQKGKYYMHYDGAGSKGWLSCRASSTDLIHWKKEGPVLDYGAPGSEDSRSASYGSVYFDGHKWHMFYMGTPQVTKAPNFIPGFPYLTKKAEAASATGPWKKRYDIEPFHTVPGTYYSSCASPGSIFKTGKEYRMIFSASTDAPMKRTLSYARTTNLDSSWAIDPLPIFDPNEQIENSALYYQPSDKTWWVFTNHIGNRNGTEYTDAIWVYWTKDPDHWDKANKAVVLDSSNCSWSPHIIGLPSVVQMGDKLALFYDGQRGNEMPSVIGANMRRDVGLAWLQLPLRMPVKRSEASAIAGRQSSPLDSLKAGFLHPPVSAHPGVYWYFMDGNRTKASMTEDMESMKKAGIRSVVFLEVNVGVPRGSVDFLSETWKEMFAHAVREGERLGIEIVLGTGPGWAGSGGPWVKPAQSMQHLVASKTLVSTDTLKGAIWLPVPMPKRPFFGVGGLTPTMRKEWEAWYQDIAVLAFPTPADTTPITNIIDKALYYRSPYTSAPNVTPYFDAPAAAGVNVAGVKQDEILDVTSRMSADGRLDWVPPTKGKWTILRMVARNNGAVTRPAPYPGLGFEVDKMDTISLQAHLDEYVGKLLEKTGKIDTTGEGGFKRLHIDSWEMGAQNWTQHFRQEFIARRGYDPLPFYPVYDGVVVGNDVVSRRFLWDLRQTAQEMVLAYHAGQVKKYSHKLGLKLSIEPYDMNPAADLELGAVADVPMCEFWSKGYGFNSSFSCIEATSIAHVNGISLVPAEAFTAQNDEGWKQYPGSMKDQGDWALATGINKFVYHTFQSQTLPDKYKPGMTMGPYGVHWDRNQTWWPMAGDYHAYISRAQFLLQQGRTVADVLYLTPEGAPHVFRAPASALSDDSVLPDRKGYNFDGCAPSQLYRASVNNGMIRFPGGASYRILVLPAFNTMTPALLEKIRSLVEAGATVVGAPPLQSPGLSGYPACDEQVAATARTIWGGLEAPAVRTVRSYGKGQVVWGGEIKATGAPLYPDYGVTGGILHEMGVFEDFISDGPIRYTHRTGNGWELYFVSNRSDVAVKTNCIFRSGGGQPQLWDPMTGEIRTLPEFTTGQTGVAVPIVFEPHQSWFVVFGAPVAASSIRGVKNFPEIKKLSTIKGAWTVRFDTVWGGPATVRFDSLTDWTRHANSGIRYYSGIARYQHHFDQPAGIGKHVYLDLGTVKDMARVRLNGVDLGVVWTAPFRVEITGHMKAKGNQLEIEVVNRWPNRLIGDEHLPDDGIKDNQWPEWLTKGLPRTSGRYTFSTHRFYDKNTPLLSSGLLGPVTIGSTGY